MNTRKVIVTLALAVSVGALALWTLRDRVIAPAPTESSTKALQVGQDSPAPSATHLATGNAPRLIASKSAAELAKVPESVRSIVDLNHNYRERLETTLKLPANLSSVELKALFDFLQERHAEDEDQGGHALKNDIMDALIRQEPLTLQIISLLTEVYRDRNQHVVIRDYSVQHLAAAYDRLIPFANAGAEGARSARNGIAATLWEALSETDSTIAGTALMGLNRLSGYTAELDRSRIAAVALNLAADPVVGDATRISALQVGARLNNPEILPLSVKLLEGETPAGIRLSAIGAIGLLGGEGQLSTLNRIIEKDSTLLRPAAVVALGRIQQRIKGGNTSVKDQF
jgi:hypothetical protein